MEEIIAGGTAVISGYSKSSNPQVNAFMAAAFSSGIDGLNISNFIQTQQAGSPVTTNAKVTISGNERGGR